MESHVTLRFFKPNRPIVVVGCLIGMIILNGCTTSPSRSGLYSVQPGDFLEKIATTYNQNVHELAEWNNISWPYTLTSGWQIRIGRPANYVPNIKFYETIPGDTWEKVATKVTQPIEFLKEWNKGLAPECCAIDPGLKLLVSSPQGYVLSLRKLGHPATPLTIFSCPVKWATVKRGKMMTWWDVVVRQCDCSPNAIADMQKRNGGESLRPEQKICCDCAKP